LTFTLWDKSDGRNGSYTHPTISTRYSPGSPIINKITKLSADVKIYQSAFISASASFTYTRMTSSNQKIDQVFESYYRPLPSICELGVSKDDYCSNDGKATDECKGYAPAASSEPVSSTKEST